MKLSVSFPWHQFYKMNTKILGLIAIAALAIMLVTTATSGDVFAHRHGHGGSHSQSLAQVNNGCSGSCSNIGSQIDGNGNNVAISSSQG